MKEEPDDSGKGAGSGWLWMVACCVPMLALIVLIALGYWNFR